MWDNILRLVAAPVLSTNARRPSDGAPLSVRIWLHCGMSAWVEENGVVPAVPTARLEPFLMTVPQWLSMALTCVRMCCAKRSLMTSP